jgi:predicted membrane protein
MVQIHFLFLTQVKYFYILKKLLLTRCGARTNMLAIIFVITQFLTILFYYYYYYYFIYWKNDNKKMRNNDEKQIKNEE